jgi:hypothetical protein
MFFTGFLCRSVGGVPFSVKYFSCYLFTCFQFLLSEDSNREEFIAKYSASDLLIIFMFLF